MMDISQPVKQQLWNVFSDSGENFEKKTKQKKKPYESPNIVELQY